MKYFIGLLSGTSVDGIDAALIAMNDGIPELCNTHSQPFSAALRRKILSNIESQSVSLKELLDTDILLAIEFADAVRQLLDKSSLNPKDIIAIGSHGQTLFHQPNGKLRNTLQIGSPHKIAAECGIDVVCNFRNLDMACSGQGAPLAPVIHQQIFADDRHNSVLVNLGGIANITLVGKDFSQPVGFDTGPANCLMDEWILMHHNKAFDELGKWARSGNLNRDLLQKMLNDPYFSAEPPKSTGREYFNLQWLEKFDISDISAVDIQTSLAHLTAVTVTDSIKKYSEDFSEIIIMGGGARNAFLKNLIESYSDANVVTADSKGYPADWIEAILFAYLAYKRMNNEKLNLSSVTGSCREILVGDIIRY